MVLGGLNKQNIGSVSAADFNFDALSKDVDQIKQRQNYILIGLLLLLFLQLFKRN